MEYPECLRIVEERVKPERANKADDVVAAPWWLFWRSRQELYNKIAALKQVLVRAQTSRTQASTFVPNGWVYDQKVIVFAPNCYGFFAVLDSNIHYVWVVNRGSTMRTDAVYTPSDCFETFPIPESLSQLEEIAKKYYSLRSQIMAERNQGLTATYNRVHDESCHDEDILQLRRLRVEMDNAVATAYGWKDLILAHGFIEGSHRK